MFIYESSVKQCLLGWDRGTPFKKKIRSSCIWDNLVSMIAEEKWIEIGWKHQAQCQVWEWGLTMLGISWMKWRGYEWKIFLSMCYMWE